MHEPLGNVIWISVKPIIKIYLIIGVGFGLAKMGILSVEATRTISDIVLTVLLPCLSFNKIVANIEDNDIKIVGIICLTSVLIFSTGLFCAWVIRRTLPVPRQWYGGILAGGMFPNISDLPIAYLQTLDQGTMFTAEEGEKGIANVIIFLAMFLFCVFNLGGFRLIENDFNYKDEESAVRDNEETNKDLSSIQESNISPTNISFKDKHIEDSFENIKDLSNQVKTTTTATDNPSSNEPSTSTTNTIASSKLHTMDEKYTSNSGSESPEIVEGSAAHDPTNTQSPRGIVKPDMGINDNTLQHVESLPEGGDEYIHSIPASSIMTSIDSNLSAGDYQNEYGNPSTRRTLSQPMAYTEDDHDSYTRHRIYSQHSFNGTTGSLITPIRSIDQRSLPAQGMNDLIHEYSNVDQFGKRRNSLASLGGSFNSNIDNDQSSSMSSLQKIKSSTLTKILTSDATVSRKDIEESGKSLPKFIQKFPLTPFIVFFLKNCLRPCSMAVIVALTIAFIPWVKAVFVTSEHTPHIKQAPDDQPALSFIMDFTAYVGAASVPFGLILLGATLGRLKIGKLYPGFWKSAAILVLLRQCIMPIFGVLWADRLVKAGWLDREQDEMLLFVMTINWALPTMTTLIYFTASYTPADCVDPIQMDCVAFFLMLQYPLLVVSLPFLVTYYLKVYLKK